MWRLISRSFASFGLMAGLETCLGITRELVLKRFLPTSVVERLGVLGAMTNVMVVSFKTITWIAPQTKTDLLIIGSIWYSSMVSFDALLGRYGRKMAWREVWSTFNPLEGGYLGIYMSVLFFAPFLSAHFNRGAMIR